MSQINIFGKSNLLKSISIHEDEDFNSSIINIKMDTGKKEELKDIRQG